MIDKLKEIWETKISVKSICILISTTISILASLNYFLEFKQSLSEIRENTSFLKKNLQTSTDGGQILTIGVNSKEIKENIAFVFDNNEYNLKPGDKIALTNYTDNTFQTTLNFVIQKSLPNSDFNSSASLFIGDEAARKIGFSDYKNKGTLKVKFKILSNNK